MFYPLSHYAGSYFVEVNELQRAEDLHRQDSSSYIHIPIYARAWDTQDPSSSQLRLTNQLQQAPPCRWDPAIGYNNVCYLESPWLHVLGL